MTIVSTSPPRGTATLALTLGVTLLLTAALCGVAAGDAPGTGNESAHAGSTAGTTDEGSLTVTVVPDTLPTDLVPVVRVDANRTTELLAVSTAGTPDLSDAEIRSLFGTTTLSVDGTDASVAIPADTDGIPHDTYRFVFTAVGTDATATDTLTVADDPWGTRPPPQDPDDDGRMEDVDGDGDLDVFDAIVYYNNRNTDRIQGDPAAFDFDGDGETGTVFDTIALYEELTS